MNESNASESKRKPLTRESNFRISSKLGIILYYTYYTSFTLVWEQLFTAIAQVGSDFKVAYTIQYIYIHTLYECGICPCALRWFMPKLGQICRGQLLGGFSGINLKYWNIIEGSGEIERAQYPGIRYNYLRFDDRLDRMMEIDTALRDHKKHN